MGYQKSWGLYEYFDFQVRIENESPLQRLQIIFFAFPLFSTIIIQHNKDKWTTSVEIERNDSGLGSETGKSGKRPVKIRDKLNNNNKTVGELHICEDCDQPIDESAATKRYIDFFYY